MVYSQEFLKRVADVVQEAGIFVVSDEIYEKVIYGRHKHFSIGSLEEIEGQVITVNGVSKAYAMTGWRIGFMGGPRTVIEAAAKVQSQTTSNANSIAQLATMAALRECQGDVARMVAELRDRRDIAYQSLRTIPGVKLHPPEGAIYAFFKVDAFFGKQRGENSVRSSEDMARYLLEENRVALVPGSAFGDDQYLRLSFGGAGEQLREGLTRITEGLRNLR
jgi:aspartate aminotransferase